MSQFAGGVSDLWEYQRMKVLNYNVLVRRKGSYLIFKIEVSYLTFRIEGSYFYIIHCLVVFKISSRCDMYVCFVYKRRMILHFSKKPKTKDTNSASMGKYNLRLTRANHSCLFMQLLGLFQHSKLS